MILALATLLACGDCLRPLGDWCNFELPEDQARDDCGEPSFRNSNGTIPAHSYRCGDYDMVVDNGGFAGFTFYYHADSGELAAVDAWTDVWGQCEGSYWYGKPVVCEVECEYHDETELPDC